MNAATKSKRLYRLAHRAVEAHRSRPPEPRFTRQPGTGTIYYLTPDFDEPSGGIRVIYRHVDLLNRAGIPAVVLHRRPGFRCTWFDNETQIAAIPSTAIGTGDLLVLPEVFSALLSSLPVGTRHVVFNQSGHLTWSRVSDRVTHHYRENKDLAGVLTVSAHSTDLLRYAFPDLAVRRTRVAIDERLFHGPPASGGRRISYTPRRGQGDMEIVLQMLRSRGVLEGWELDPLDSMRQAVVADRLRRSTIFLNFAYQEGFGLAPAEAMACGNYVIGFHGFGGREFFRSDFSCAVPTGDVLALAHAVEMTIEQEHREPGWCAARGAEASRFVLAEYSRAGERADVINFFREIFTD